MFRMIHVNFNVLDMERSVAFYREALGLLEIRRKQGEGFTLCFLTDESGQFQLELTCLNHRKEPYDLGDNETHLAFEVDDYEAAHAKHAQMGCICYENPQMGIYFINDPDGYWLEIVPKR